jgi:hypothetical protein
MNIITSNKLQSNHKKPQPEMVDSGVRVNDQ